VATVKTENTTAFATQWMAANAALMDAIANPSRLAFEAAHAEAIRAIGKAYTMQNETTEWEMGQQLARMISDVARENGYAIR
jgi:hypothetical protein